MRCAGLGSGVAWARTAIMGVPTMAQAKTFVAFDVHVSGTVAAVIDRESGELRRRRLSGRSEEVAAFVAGLPGPVRATYEAGPTGFALARRLEAAGVDCLVCAPGLIPRGPSDRVKTDQRDAERLVRLLMAGELHRGRGPERRGGGAARSGAGARGPARRSDERAPPGGQAAAAPRRALRRPQSATGPSRICAGCRPCASSSRGAGGFDDYRGAVEALVIRRDQLECRDRAQLPARRGRRPPGG